MGRRQPRSQHLPGLPIQSTPDDRTGVNIEPDTRTLTDHWGLPRLWLYRQGPSLSGNPRSSVAGPQPPYRLESSASVIGLLRLDVNVARLGRLIGLLILVAGLWHPAAELLERLLVW